MKSCELSCTTLSRVDYLALPQGISEKFDSFPWTIVDEKDGIPSNPSILPIGVAQENLLYLREFLPVLEQSIELVVGGITDLASIPPLVHSIMRKLGKHNVAAAFHDQLYKLRDSRGKAFADALFLAIMRYKGVSGWRRTAMYQSVVMYGRGEWDDDD